MQYARNCVPFIPQSLIPSSQNTRRIRIVSLVIAWHGQFHLNEAETIRPPHPDASFQLLGSARLMTLELRRTHSWLASGILLSAMRNCDVDTDRKVAYLVGLWTSSRTSSYCARSYVKGQTKSLTCRVQGRLCMFDQTTGQTMAIGTWQIVMLIW